jgi:ATP-binding cassette subfamily B protein
VQEDKQSRGWGNILVRYLAPQRWPVALLAVLLLTTIGLQLAGPQIIAAFIDGATNGAAASVLLRLAIMFIVIALANQGLTIWAVYVGQQVGWTATNRLREDLARHCLAQDIAFHTARTPGEFIERIDGDLTALSNFFSEFVIRLVGSALLLVGVVVILWFENPIVGGALTLFTVLAGGMLHRVRRIAIHAGTQERQASANLFGFIEERLAGSDDLRANGGGAYAVRRLHLTLRDLFRSGMRAWMLRSTIRMTTLTLFTVGYALVFALGAILFERHAITLGMVYLFFQYTQMLQAPLEEISRQMQDFQKAASSLVRVQELFAIKPTIVDGTSARVPDGALGVDFAGVTFAYNEAGPVLHGVSFALAPGQILGLLGHTGSGKTTIARLLCRLYEIQTGAIRLGGVDLRDVPLADLRQRVGIVTQDVQLFHATVRDNLTFFDASISDARLHDAIHTLGLTGWYGRLPDGLDTELAAGGAGLSAGEAQVLAFLRVFLRDPGLVILDEPTARLDPATEALIEQGMRRLLAGRTAVIIAHRLATVARADQIIILDHGHISESGARAALANDPASQFAALLRTGLEEVLA